MEKFTKGPWSWNGYSLVLVEDTPLCALVNSAVNTGDPSEDYANAALIAAAPDMYKEIKQDIEWLERMKSLFVIGSTEFTSCCLRIKTKKELLAKARGEQ